jgi:hypothetical protein
MVIIHFDDTATEKNAIEFLIGRFPFKTWKNGDLMLPEAAVGLLAAEGITFRARGPAQYEHFLPPLRDTAPSAV